MIKGNPFAVNLVEQAMKVKCSKWIGSSYSDIAAHLIPMRPLAFNAPKNPGLVNRTLRVSSTRIA